MVEESGRGHSVIARSIGPLVVFTTSSMNVGVALSTLVTAAPQHNFHLVNCNS